jgi:hypothetical protein
MREIRTRTIHVASGGAERSTESEARLRAESIIESETTRVHTVMHADGGGVVQTYRREGEEWVIDSRVRFDAHSPTRFTPRREPSRPDAIERLIERARRG